MKNFNSKRIRSLFLMGGVAAMMGMTMAAPQAARADEGKNYKYGAAALGVLGAIFAAKGKAVPAIAAGAGAYYAYKKGADIQEQEKYDDYYDRRDYDRNYDRNYDRSRDYRDNRDYRNDSRYNNNSRYDYSNNNNYRNDSRKIYAVK